MSSLKRVLVASASLVLTMALSGTAGAEPKAEHFKETNEFTSFGEDNPCTPQFDDVTLSIREHIQGKTWIENGKRFTELHVTGHAHGVAADGTEYIAKLNVKDTIVEEDSTGTSDFQSILRAISKGSTPNFFIKEIAHVTFDPFDITYELQRMECRG